LFFFTEPINMCLKFKQPKFLVLSIFSHHMFL